MDSFRRSLLKLDLDTPLRQYISGEAGSGKSSVVEALKYLAMSWGRPEAISTVAPTGIASVFISEETVHSKFLIQSRGISRENEKEEISQRSKIYVLIWDEIRMTGQALFCKAYKNMRRFLCTAEGEEPRVH